MTNPTDPYGYVLVRLNGAEKYGANQDQCITTCKKCRRSLLKGQDRVWLTDPMGLSHQVCPDEGNR